MVKNYPGPPFLGIPQDNANIQEKQDKQPNQTAGENEITISRKRKYTLIIKKHPRGDHVTVLRGKAKGKAAQEMRGRDKLSLCPEYINCLVRSFFLSYKTISSNFHLSPKVLERNK